MANLTPGGDCNCRFCRTCRTLDKIMTKGDRRAMAKAIDYLANQLCQTGEELDYLRCIMNGSWPSAKRILRTALRKMESQTEDIDGS